METVGKSLKSHQTFLYPIPSSLFWGFESEISDFNVKMIGEWRERGKRVCDILIKTCDKCKCSSVVPD